ncbi:MAG TPA: type II toxin-antitoxin system VapC family toxin [Verrucomicrobiae bacterium]|nr:type II toxin-antitoxin system VapC family toxin [Verrucomicrobiae bacterium]
MIAYPDTSFLCALYRRQVNSSEAAAYFKMMPEALHVSSLLLFEFRQSLRFQVWLHAQSPLKGFSQMECDQALVDLQSDLESGVTKIIPVDWSDVHHIGERLSARYTAARGFRAFDLLHVATALHLNARNFLTFDANQRKAAASEGLKVKP